MNFREFNQRFLEPGSQLFMVGGIVFLCQPWIEVLHSWSVTIMLLGLIGFNVAVHVPPPDKPADETTGASHG
jgi:hypothetical protein